MKYKNIMNRFIFYLVLIFFCIKCFVFGSDLDVEIVNKTSYEVKVDSLGGNQSGGYKVTFLGYDEDACADWSCCYFVNFGFEQEVKYYFKGSGVRLVTWVDYGRKGKVKVFYFTSTGA